MKETIFIGLDVGGTKTSVSMGNEEGKIERRVSFETQGSWKNILNKSAGFIKEFSQNCSVKAVGISCGGPLNREKGIIQSPPNLPGWDNVPICSYLKEKTGFPCYLENDADAGALAEWMWGAGQGSKNMIFLTFGTGFGAGLILNGRLYRGCDGLAGETGHIRLAEEGPAGYGKKGSWEGFCSGAGLSTAYHESFGEVLTGKEICQRAVKGDKKALSIINQSAEYLGRGLAMLVDLLNPELVVIGSIFSRDEALFRPVMERYVEREALTQSVKSCSILPAALGEDLGDRAALGAAINRCREQGEVFNCVDGNINKDFLGDLINRYPRLKNSQDDITAAAVLLVQAVKKGRKILICGNGGSSADADHIVGELMKSFILERPLNKEFQTVLKETDEEWGGILSTNLQQGIRALSLCSASALNTAFSNDVNPELIYAQQVSVLGEEGDLLWCLSTSGNSKNIIAAAVTAKARGMNTIAMTGCEKSHLSRLCQVTVRVNERETYKVQELHLPVYHALCLTLENHFFG